MKRQLVGPWFLVLVVVFAGACALLTRPRVRTLFNEKGLDRAAFEMQCPKEQLALVPLSPPLDDEVYSGAQVGVTGCGRKTVYVYTNAGGWVANTASISDQGPAK
jgi:hypothetical protein